VKRRFRIDAGLLSAVVVAVVVVGMYTYAIASADRFVKSGLAESTTFSSAPEGTKVFFRYLDELGLEPKTLQQFDTLPQHATLIIAANQPLAKPIRPEEARTLGSWVNGGGRVVFAGAYVRDFIEALGLESGTSLGENVALQPALPSVYVQDVASVRADRTRIFASDTDWAAVLRDDDGLALAVRRVGAGEVIWLADAYPITNEGISEADNARLGVLLAAAAPDREIWFDEYHHGFARGGGVLERVGAGGQSALLLFGIGVALLLAAYSRRLGPPIPVTETPVARTMAYIDSLASLYRKAGARREAIAALEDGLTRSLARRYGSPVMGRARHTAAAAALDRAAALHDREHVPAEEFVTVAGMIACARREVEGIDD